MTPQDTAAAGTAGSGPGAVRDAAHETIDSVRQEASGLASRATERGKSMLARQKDTAARRVDSVADALRGTARQLEGGEQETAGRYAGYAAERLQSLGRQLRERDVDTLIRNAQDLGRRAPGAFFAGSVVAGFLMARFMKASSQRTPSPDDASRHASPAAPDAGGHGGPGDARHGDAGADLRSGRTGTTPGSGAPTVAGTATDASVSSGPQGGASALITPAGGLPS
jgi:hypothetical protein